MKKVLIILIIIFITGCFNNNINKKNNDKLTDAEIKRYYETMESKMKEYYRKHYNDIKKDLTGDLEEAVIKIPLESLYKVYDYDVSSFINLETKKECNFEESFAYIIQKPDKEVYPDEDIVIEVYFKCGEYTNREYPKEVPSSE
ncbi:MAG: hypothetical protein WC267_02525 [Bacilli bacterium]